MVLKRRWRHIGRDDNNNTQWWVDDDDDGHWRRKKRQQIKSNETATKTDPHTHIRARVTVKEKTMRKCGNNARTRFRSQRFIGFGVDSVYCAKFDMATLHFVPNISMPNRWHVPKCNAVSAHLFLFTHSLQTRLYQRFDCRHANQHIFIASIETHSHSSDAVVFVNVWLFCFVHRNWRSFGRRQSTFFETGRKFSNFLPLCEYDTMDVYKLQVAFVSVAAFSNRSIRQSTINVFFL